MKQKILGILAIVLGLGVIFWISNQRQEPAPAINTNTKIYENNQLGFSIELPNNYSVDGKHVYQISPTRAINGVKFTIPQPMTVGTNLASDSYLSVESIPQSSSISCTADLFLDGTHTPRDVVQEGTRYSVVEASNAGAGNRYEETVYALSDSNPCLAVRYVIHYGVIQNYPEGTVMEFDKEALLDEFNSVRRTLEVKPVTNATNNSSVVMKTWTWVGAIYSDNKEIRPKQEGKFTLTFKSDGTFSATTDCNSMFGGYTASNGTIEFSDIAMTKMFCEGSQEMDYLRLLRDSSSYTFGQTGELIFSLKMNGGQVTFK